MAERFPGDPAAMNGFGRRQLTPEEGRLLYKAGYPAPPDFRAPQTWHLSTGGVTIPPALVGEEMVDEIHRVLAGMSDEDRADPRFFPDNFPAWRRFFRDREQRELDAYEGPLPAPKKKNAAGRRRWWGGEGRTLANVLAYIQAGNSPPL